MEKRLASYVPVETDPALDGELRRLVRSGLEKQTELPALPPPPDPADAPVAPARQRRGRRRRSTPAT